MQVHDRFVISSHGYAIQPTAKSPAPGWPIANGNKFILHFFSDPGTILTCPAVLQTQLCLNQYTGTKEIRWSASSEDPGYPTIPFEVILTPDTNNPPSFNAGVVLCKSQGDNRVMLPITQATNLSAVLYLIDTQYRRDIIEVYCLFCLSGNMPEVRGYHFAASTRQLSSQGAPSHNMSNPFIHMNEYQGAIRAGMTHEWAQNYTVAMRRGASHEVAGKYADLIARGFPPEIAERQAVGGRRRKTYRKNGRTRRNTRKRT